ncbi:MAG TPA: right-handed parallel beta-helix repeat-containing protein [bacterium]
MRLKTLFCLALSATAMMAGSATARTYFVDASNGKDDNDGSSESTAWRSISKVNGTNLQPGDVVRFKSGEIWREELAIKNDGVSGIPVMYEAYGNGPKPIITAADLFVDWTPTPGADNVWQTTTPTQTRIVVFDGELGKETTARLSVDREFEWYWENNILYVYSTVDPAQLYREPGVEVGVRNNAIFGNARNYYTIDGLDLRGANGKQNSGAGLLLGGDYVTIKNCTFVHNFYAGIHAADAADNGTVINCEIHHNQDNGIALGRGTGWSVSDCKIFSNGYGPRVRSGILFDTRNTTISRCIIYDNGNGSTELGLTHGIYVNPTAVNVTIEDCVIYDHRNGNGINYDANSGNIRRNYIFNNYFSGIHLENQDAGGQISIYNNIVYGNNTGIMLYEWQWNPGTKVNIFNNTLYENNRYLLVAGKVDQEPYELCILANIKELKICNNIFYKSSPYVAIYAVKQSHIFSDNNCIYKSVEPNGPSCSYDGKTITFNDWQTATGGDAHSLAIDPQFVSGPKNQPPHFKLNCTSPCRGIGATSVSAIVTKDFEGRPFDGRDIGAFLVSCDNDDLQAPRRSVNMKARMKKKPRTPQN